MHACAVRRRGTLDPEPHGTLHAVQQYQSESPQLYFNIRSRVSNSGKTGCASIRHIVVEGISLTLCVAPELLLSMKRYASMPPAIDVPAANIKNKTKSPNAMMKKTDNRVGSKASSQ